MVKITTEDINFKILQKIAAIEQFLIHRLKYIEEKLILGQDSFQFFNDGLKAQKERILKEYKLIMNYDFHTERF